MVVSTLSQSSTRSSVSLRFGSKTLLAVLALGILLRLFFVLVIARGVPVPGGDTDYYLNQGYLLVTGAMDKPVQPGPVYLIYVGLVQLIFGQAGVKLTLQLLNILWHVGLLLAVYQLGRHYFSQKAGLLAALFIAINPIFIIESGVVLTESIFLTLLFGALWLYAASLDKMNWLRAILIGVLFGLAALTRVVLLAFPVALMVVHVGWRQRLWKLAIVMFAAYALTVSTWTVYNYAKWNRFIIGGEGFTAFAYMGATGQVSQYEIDAALGEAAVNDERDPAFIAGVVERLRNLPDYVRTRLVNFGEAYLQPHNTIFFPGESLKELALNWFLHDRSLRGLWGVTEGDAFWSKLVLFIFHYVALIGGVIGMWRARKQFWLLLPIYGYFLYTTAVHLVLYAHPRYIFPVTPILILFCFGAGLLPFAVNRHNEVA